MSDKGRVFKAHFSIVDNVHHCHVHEHFTTARREQETLSHFILRLIGFCLFAYRHDLELCETKRKPQLDIVASSLVGDYALVVEVFDDNVSDLSKIANQTSAMYVITTAPINSELEHWLSLHRSVEVIVVEHQAVEKLVELLQRSMQWDVCVESDSLCITANEQYICTSISIQWPQ
ncbi:YaeQ family protein [Pseudoalteromonas sp. SSDWG2]|uniref:YaeQ family protein n=1 Tax=Pseudoalteromonas sp. SSDWG2 TaxID=3139391 RepID=UPI003BABC0E8